MDNNNIILSLDLATKTGYAILEDNTITEYNTITFRPTKKELDIYNWLKKIVRAKNITSIIIESCYIDSTRKNIGIRLAKLHGVIDLFAQSKDIPVIEYEPTKYRRIIGAARIKYKSPEDYRKYLKETSINFAKKNGYNVNSDDEADAITMLMYHAQTNKIPIKRPTQNKAL